MTDPPASARIRSAEISIRDRVTHAKLRPRLTSIPKTWNEVVSSLDAIGDTEQALTAYECRYPSDADHGTKYLLVYGALQALFIQQDAVIHLAEALGGPPDKEILADPRLRKAREIRNQAIGHPTRKDLPKKLPASTHQISRISLTQAGFDMLSADEGGGTHISRVSVSGLIADQRQAIAELLESIDHQLEDEDQKARLRFKNERLVDLFPGSLGYAFQKLYEATRGDPHGILGPPHLEMIKGLLKAFSQALERRGLSVDSYSGVKDWFAEVEHPLEELGRFYSAADGAVHPKTAAILVGHLERELAELKGMAAEIDEDWRVKEPDSEER